MNPSLLAKCHGYCWTVFSCLTQSHGKEDEKKPPLSRLGCQQMQRQKPVLSPGQKLGTDHLKLREIHTTGLESLSCTSQVNHNKSLKRKGQTCEVLFVFTETSSPTYSQPNQQRNQLPLVRLKPDPRNERRTWPPGKRNHEWTTFSHSEGLTGLILFFPPLRKDQYCCSLHLLFLSSGVASRTVRLLRLGFINYSI